MTTVNNYHIDQVWIVTLPNAVTNIDPSGVDHLRDSFNRLMMMGYSTQQIVQMVAEVLKEAE